MSRVSELVHHKVADISQDGGQEKRIAEIGEECDYTNRRELPGVKGPQHMEAMAFIFTVENVHKVIDVRQDSGGHGDGDGPRFARRGPYGASEAARHDDMDYRPQRQTLL